jgi:hypothetical protein
MKRTRHEAKVKKGKEENFFGGVCGLWAFFCFDMQGDRVTK